jgi:hypothetical protein
MQKDQNTVKNNCDLAVLVDGKKLTSFVILKRKNLTKEKLPVELYLNVMRKGG